MDNAELAYIVVFGSIIVDLHHLLRIPIERKRFDEVTAEDFRSFTPVEKALYVIATHHAKGQHDARNIELERMFALVKDLKVIRHYKPALFRKFKRELIGTGTTDSFFGTRFEVTIAKGLIAKSINFDKADPPDADFEIRRDGRRIFIECGSARIRQDATGDISYKVASKIKEKSAKPYAKSTTALFLDLTNLLYSSMNTQFELYTAKAEEIAMNAVNSSGFGAIALFFYLFNRQTNWYGCGYVRADSSNIDSDLKILLDDIIPDGELITYEVVIPSEG